MNQQLNLRLSPKLLQTVTKHAKSHGYGTVQEFIKETVREKLFEKPAISKGEMQLIKKLIAITEKESLYGTEEELFAKLKEK
tara:strand:- start:1686 stop:1931 length:246 start_codon:yes stop_codon:yes gene_type:complete